LFPVRGIARIGAGERAWPMARALYVATATARRLKTRHIRPTNGRDGKEGNQINNSNHYSTEEKDFEKNQFHF
jgi:hypothetical protein